MKEQPERVDACTHSLMDTLIRGLHFIKIKNWEPQWLSILPILSHLVFPTL